MNLFTDENGKTSTTRVVLLTCLALFLTCGFVDIFTRVEISERIYDVLEITVPSALGVTGLRTSIKNWKKNEQ